MLTTLRHILHHPLNRGAELSALARFVGWQVRSRTHAGPHVVPFAGRSRLLVARGMVGATGNIYCGLHEFRSMALTLHLLRPGDLFADVGANVGTYSILGAETGADVVALEPHPRTAEHLRRNITLNRFADRVQVVEACAGAAAETVYLTDTKDTMNHVADRGIAVPVVRLDDVLPRAPTFLKMDVEGYEGPALLGSRRSLAQALAVSVEMGNVGQGLGWSDDSIHEFLVGLGYSPVSYDPLARNFTDVAMGEKDENNVIYLRDREAAKARVVSAPFYRVGARLI